MSRLKRKAQLTLALLIPLLLSACFGIKIIDDVKDPEPYFDEAYSEIDRIHKQHPNREGIPSRIHLMFYDCADRDLVMLELPLSLIEGSLDLCLEETEEDWRFDFEDRFDFDWSEIKDVRQLGMGLLVEVDSEEGKILIWLD